MQLVEKSRQVFLDKESRRRYNYGINSKIFVKIVERKEEKMEKGIIEKVTLTEKKVETLNTEVGSLNTKVDSLNTEVGRLNTEVDKLSTEVGSLNTKVDKLSTEVGSLNTKVDKLSTEVDSLNTKVDREVKKLQTEIETLNTKVDTLEKEMKDLKVEIIKIGNVVTKMEYEHSKKLDLILDILLGHTEELKEHNIRFEKNEKILEMHSHRIYALEEQRKKA